ncbi:MAG: hypothetical protein CMM93_02405 [Rickettsiales bacterium]|nr:hypothetical protein [Rickettsiales bacterium]|tara:strand:- start:3123 stop:3443 length:321 start_codon:yes stop_codon:yes gene_type:complete
MPHNENSIEVRVALLEQSQVYMTNTLDRIANSVEQLATYQPIIDRNNREFPEIKKEVLALHDRVDVIEQERRDRKTWNNGAMWAIGGAVTFGSFVANYAVKYFFGG